MKNILVAYDGSPGAEAAIRDMARAGFADRVEAKVASFADVWLPPAPLDPAAPERSDYPAIYDDAVALLEKARQTAIDGAKLLHCIHPGWTISNIAAADSPAWGILNEARRWPADLIVIGSHGRSPLEKFFLGSISYKVAAEASCSVRIVRPHEHRDRPMRIMIAMDGSSDAQLALEEVLARRWQPGTEVHLVTVTDPKLKSALLRRKVESGAQPVKDRVDEMVEASRAKVEKLGLNAHAHILDGDPKSVLLRQAQKWEVQTIFLGARGLEHGNRLYLGTLASAICTRAHCSVEIVRPLQKG